MMVFVQTIACRHTLVRPAACTLLALSLLGGCAFGPDGEGTGDADETKSVAGARCAQLRSCPGNYARAMRTAYCGEGAGALVSSLVRAVGLNGAAPPVPAFSYASVVMDFEGVHSDGWNTLGEAAQREGIYTALNNRSISDTNPNRYGRILRLLGVAGGGDQFASTRAPQAEWFRWNMTIHVPGEYSIYTYVPPGENLARHAHYRIYADGGERVVGQQSIDQSQYGAAPVTLGGETYTLPGWHFLGKHSLRRGAHVTLDASQSADRPAAGQERQRVFADTVVAVQWGCP